MRKALKKIYGRLPGGIRYPMEPLVMKSRKIARTMFFKKESVDIFPRIIQIETNNFCGGLCVFCPYEDLRKKEDRSLMPRELFRKVMDESSGYKVDIIYLCLMNDPVSDKRIAEFIDYAKSKNPKAKVKIMTTAGLLSGDTLDSLAASRLDEMRFSVHGWTKDSYRKIMGGDFDRVFKNIKDFIEKTDRKRTDIGMVCVKTKHFTGEDYVKAYDFCRRNGIEFGLSEACNMAGNLRESSEKELGMRNIKRKALRGCIDNWPCNSVHITYDGKVVACCMDWKKEIVLGDLSSASVHEIWNGDRYKDFRDKVYNRKPSEDGFICKRCSEAV